MVSDGAFTLIGMVGLCAYYAVNLKDENFQQMFYLFSKALMIAAMLYAASTAAEAQLTTALAVIGVLFPIVWFMFWFVQYTRESWELWRNA